MKYNIGVVNWNSGDGLSDAIHKTIQNIGHKSIHFIYNQPVPSEIDIVFSFAPYGKFLVLANNISNLSSNRPMFIHWDTEMQVNPAIPVNLMFTIAKWRSLFGRILLSQYNLAKSPLRYLDRFYRLQCLGDYSYAYEQGWLDILFEFSEYFTNYLNKIGIPAIFIPWGAHPDWYENLGVKRDIDVLWMGSWRTRKRRNTFNQLKSKLEPLGVKFFIADNEVHPFIYGKLRTELLNRSKITLNLSTTWYVSNFDS